MNEPSYRGILTMRSKLLACLCLFGLLAWALPALADDVAITTSFDALGEANAQEYQHNDADPFKGWVDLTVTNTGTDPWGDFHFEIFQVPFGDPVGNVDFITTIVGPDDYRPTKDGNLVDFAVDNVTVGATLDLFFYDDPVLPTQTVNFKVYTTNPDHVSFFGLMVYPTPVPEPATMLLVGMGGLALLAWKRRR
jgi:hypothetical protein